jgi:3-methyladenine DNA glycosylase/8-oxoguanine DNA glycosylase
MSVSSSCSSSKTEILLPVRDYDLAATLDSGQMFRWQPECGRPARVNQKQTLAGEPPALPLSWTGVVGKHFVRLTQTGDVIRAQTAAPVADWQWLRDFLQTDTDLAAVLETFPDDEPMRAAVAACRGLRVLRQEPWECLASFILSSTKQIVQIRQIISLLCERFGEPLTLTLSPSDGAREQQSNLSPFSHDHSANPASDFSKRLRTILPLPKGEGRGENSPKALSRFEPLQPQDAQVVDNQIGDLEVHGEGKGTHRESSDSLFYSFPPPEKIAGLTESELRACKMGFRAPHLLAAARQIAGGTLDLEKIRSLPLPEARVELMKLRGVGEKIADCVLLFACGFDSAFPVDVWVERALRQLYFPRRRVTEKDLRQFAATHFGPHAGYAQQYLFHYMRTKREHISREGREGDGTLRLSSR